MPIAKIVQIDICGVFSDQIAVAKKDFSDRHFYGRYGPFKFTLKCMLFKWAKILIAQYFRLRGRFICKKTTYFSNMPFTIP
jgi:purine-cytosine permease-like protein